MQFSIYWFRKRKKEIEIMSLFGKKKDKKITEAINGLISIAEWQERQRQAAIQQFVKRCEALYEQQRKERRN